MDAMTPQLLDSSSALATVVPESAVWLANFTSERTRRTYRNAIAEFVAVMGVCCEEDWTRIKPAHAIAWRERMRGENRSKRTIHTKLSALSSLFKHLKEKQVVVDNPVRDIRRPKVTTDQVASVVLTKAQALRLLQTPAGDTLIGLRDRAVLATFFYTGARIESVCRLRVKDFFEDGGYMVLEFAVKGGRNKRVAINQEHQAALRRYLVMAGHGDCGEAFLFGHVKRKGRGDGLKAWYVWSLVKKYARLAGLSAKVTPHSARATFITEALNAGVPIEQVQNTVDHKNIATTRMYDKRRVSYRESATFRVHY